jgi:hypothetical protein
MGRDISKQSFSDDDYIQFNRRIHDQLDILNKVIAKSEFCTGEIYIVA